MKWFRQAEEIKELQNSLERLRHDYGKLVCKDDSLQKNFDALETSYDRLNREYKDIEKERDKYFNMVREQTEADIALTAIKLLNEVVHGKPKKETTDQLFALQNQRNMLAQQSGASNISSLGLSGLSRFQGVFGSPFRGLV